MVYGQFKKVKHSLLHCFQNEDREQVNIQNECYRYPGSKK
jgi:hypothetical protein